MRELDGIQMAVKKTWWVCAWSGDNISEHIRDRFISSEYSENFLLLFKAISNPPFSIRQTNGQTLSPQPDHLYYYK